MALLFVSPTNTKATTLHDIAERGSASLVYLEAPYFDHLTNSVKSGSVGTGFVVSETGFIVTAYHVIRDWQAQNDQEQSEHPIVAKLGGKFGEQLEVGFVGKDEDADIAVLRFRREQKYTSAPLCFSEAPKTGETLYALGFANGADIAPQSGSFNNANADDSRWLASINFSGGMSGGPVYDSIGVVVGVIEGGDASNTSNYITPIRWARQVIESRAVITEHCSPLIPLLWCTSRRQPTVIVSWTR